MMNDLPHEYYMQIALDCAKQAFQRGEVPIGSVLVLQGQVIATAYNRVEELKDATAHAEMLCLQQACRILDKWRLLDAVLYCTLEPCSMCAGAMLLSRIATLVWGAPDLRHGAGGSWTDLFSLKHPSHQLQVVSGVLQQESALLLRQFFQQRRQKQKK